MELARLSHTTSRSGQKGGESRAGRQAGPVGSPRQANRYAIDSIARCGRLTPVVSDDSSSAGAEQKKGADKGVDGRLYFHDDPKGKTKQIIFSVKAGHMNVSHLRDLRGGTGSRERGDWRVASAMEKLRTL